jgi:hypothetical protein
MDRYVPLLIAIPVTWVVIWIIIATVRLVIGTLFGFLQGFYWGATLPSREVERRLLISYLKSLDKPTSADIASTLTFLFWLFICGAASELRADEAR